MYHTLFNVQYVLNSFTMSTNRKIQEITVKPTWQDILPYNFNVVVSIIRALHVVESDGVEHLVNDGTESEAPLS